jgi:hypothetical protein
MNWGLAYQKAPDPAWGPQLVGADAAHLAFFDATVKKMVRRHLAVALVGLAMLLGALAWRQVTGNRIVGGPPQVFLVAVGGVIALFGGLWIPLQLSFAARRMWGIYERGVVAPFYDRGGPAGLVPWEDISIVKVRRMRGTGKDPGAEVFLFRFEEWTNAYALHRIWESVLQQWFGYKPEESIRFREEILAAIRPFLTPAQIVVETEIGAP